MDFALFSKCDCFTTSSTSPARYCFRPSMYCFSLVSYLVNPSMYCFSPALYYLSPARSCQVLLLNLFTYHHHRKKPLISRSFCGSDFHNTCYCAVSSCHDSVRYYLRPSSVLLLNRATVRDLLDFALFLKYVYFTTVLSSYAMCYFNLSMYFFRPSIYCFSPDRTCLSPTKQCF